MFQNCCNSWPFSLHPGIGNRSHVVGTTVVREHTLPPKIRTTNIKTVSSMEEDQYILSRSASS
jgi:hypothetical protein